MVHTLLFRLKNCQLKINIIVIVLKYLQYQLQADKLLLKTPIYLTKIRKFKYLLTK